MFNNAGFGGALGLYEEIPAEEFDMTFDVLVKGVFLGMKHAVPVMRAQGGGSIINTGSIAGVASGRGPLVYSAAKGRGDSHEQDSRHAVWQGQHSRELHLPRLYPDAAIDEFSWQAG